MWAFTSPPRWSTRRSRRRSTFTSGPQMTMAPGMTTKAATVSFQEIMSMAASATARRETI